jgi:hypothetical protein
VIALAELHAEFPNRHSARKRIRAASTASTAIEALIERQFLVRTEEGMIFDNQFFRRWTQFNGTETSDVS